MSGNLNITDACLQTPDGAELKASVQILKSHKRQLTRTESQPLGSMDHPEIAISESQHPKWLFILSTLLRSNITLKWELAFVFKRQLLQLAANCLGNYTAKNVVFKSCDGNTTLISCLHKNLNMGRRGRICFFVREKMKLESGFS